MKILPRFILFGALLLVLLTTACGADQGTAPTLVGTTLPNLQPTPTLPVGLDSTATTESFPTTDPASAFNTPTVSGAQGAATQVPTLAVSATPGTGQALVPVTGLDIVLVECQFCVDNIAHALLVLPDTATFEVVPSTTAGSTLDVSCSTIEVNNGRQVILCRGPETTPITLNICTGSNCTNFPVDLLACPLDQSQTQPQSNNPVPTKTKSAAEPTAASDTATPETLPSPAVTATP